ncbi:MAG: hemerythrin family protein [Candidatus Omnitrophica bacterium]|nr:hemerythrin family protein [Candidatus Omnitrophota bacterium]
MAMITWSDSLKVDIKVIDEQHKIWIGLINKLHEAMLQGKGKEILGEVYTELINYTIYHFDFEEKLFQQYGYKESLSHIQMHANLTQRVKDLKTEFEKGTFLITIDTMDFLNDWLYNHIMKPDKQYASFLKSKGVV